MDIDEILSRAETQEVPGEDSSVANDLLSQFKMASFAMNEEEFDDKHLEGGGEGRRISTSSEGNRN